MGQRPRPKNEPVVLPWMWFNMVMNGFVLSLVIIAVYILALVHYCDNQIFQDDINALDDYQNKLMNAQTVAFISLVFSENVRSYTSRSFDQPIWRNLCGNPDMHKAIILAQLALYAAVLIPFFSEEILGLRGMHIGWWGWGVALAGPVATLILCELCKVITYFQIRQHQRRLAEASETSEIPGPSVQEPQGKLSAAGPADEGGLGSIVRSNSFKRPNSYSEFNEVNASTQVAI